MVDVDESAAFETEESSAGDAITLWLAGAVLRGSMSLAEGAW